MQTRACDFDLSWRLENWGARMGRRYEPAEVGSAESAYVNPQSKHWRYTVTEVPGDEVPGAGEDAVEIDQAVASLALRYDFLLRAHYVWRADPLAMRRFARKVGFRKPTDGDVDAALAMGRALLAAQLEIPSVVRKARQREWIDRRIELERMRRETDAD